MSADKADQPTLKSTAPSFVPKSKKTSAPASPSKEEPAASAAAAHPRLNTEAREFRPKMYPMQQYYPVPIVYPVPIQFPYPYDSYNSDSPSNSAPASEQSEKVPEPRSEETKKEEKRQELPSDPAIVSASEPVVKEVEPEELEEEKDNVDEEGFERVEDEKSAKGTKKAKKKAATRLKTYSVSYLLKFKSKCQKRPKDMRPINISLRSNLNMKFEYDENVVRSETAESVRNLRILLNKLSKDNYPRIIDTILNSIQYNQEILKELAHMLFNKCVKEHTYIDLYMGLVDELIRKFPGKKGSVPDTDFKKMFISKCQATFEKNEAEEFLKEFPGDLDEEEKVQKRKQRVAGTMKLIGQLYIRGAMPEGAVVDCLKKLFLEVKEENCENACHLLLTIGKKLYERYAFDAGQSTLTRRPKIKYRVITREVLDDYVDRLASLKKADGVSSRIKFFIQDVLDARNKEWVQSFDLFPVSREIVYKRKLKSIDKPEELPAPPTKYEMEADPKLKQQELRKKSINETNVIGRNLEKFQKTQIEERVRLRIQNAVDEYLLQPSLEEVKEIIKEIGEQELLPKCICIGHFLIWSFSKNPKQFPLVYRMVIDLAKREVVTTVDIDEGVMVLLANFYDTLIDNPNATLLFAELGAALEASALITKDKLATYHAHIEELQKHLEEEYQV